MIKFKHSLSNYIITFIITSIFVFSVCLYAEIELLFRCQNKVYTEELELQNLKEFYNIEQLEKLLRTEPNNHIAHIKLAQIYESLKEYPQAEEHYSKALKASENSDYSLFSYSLFLAKRGKLLQSTTLCEKISTMNKKGVEYRAKIYKAIADNLSENKHPEGAQRAYQIAYKYAKSMSDHDFYNNVKNSYSNELVNLADENIKKGEIQEAVSNLLNSISIKDNINAKYKLALVYEKINPEESQKLLSEVFKENPYMVNPYIYNSVLEKLASTAKAEEDISRYNYYVMKQKKLRKKLKDTHIYKNDITVNNVKLEKEKQKLNLKNSYFLTFDLKNNEKIKIKTLYMDFEFYVGKEKYTLSKEIISPKGPLGYYDSKDIKICIPESIPVPDFDNTGFVTIKFFAKKRISAPPTLIKIESLNI